MKHIIREILSLFVQIEEYDFFEWTWDSPAEREAFRKYFKFCH